MLSKNEELFSLGGEWKLIESLTGILLCKSSL